MFYRAVINATGIIVLFYHILSFCVVLENHVILQLVALIPFGFDQTGVFILEQGVFRFTQISCLRIVSLFPDFFPLNYRRNKSYFAD
jgi:hypothetical protein